MKEKVIAVFDIGKTNKKLLLFNQNLELVYLMEDKLPVIVDENGDECDDIDLIEQWLQQSLRTVLESDVYDIKAVNFSTYGASLAFLGENGERLTPIYNYLKKVPENIQEELFSKFEGEAKFCRQTASPALGLLLNSGIQILWLKQYKPKLYAKVTSILHFPQYLSYVLTKAIHSESTSIGCHTFLWDFDNSCYHSWLADEGITLPKPKSNTHTIPVDIQGKGIHVGVGIHDSSASIAPYILSCKEEFMLVSTGTWCINMNPFNHEPLTEHQLKSDCLSFLSVDQLPVKSSRLFLGHIHDTNMKRINQFFNVDDKAFDLLEENTELILNFLSGSYSGESFFIDGLPQDYIDNDVKLEEFSDFSEAYHRFIFDLCLLNKASMDLIMGNDENIKNIYISGGFARNKMFVRILATLYPDKKVFTTEIDNSSALGAALVVYNSVFESKISSVDLGLTAWSIYE